MTKTVVKAALTMALLAGCGGIGLRGVEAADESGAGGDATKETVAPRSEALKVDLRMRGIGADSYRKLVLMPGRIVAKADGVLLPVQPRGDLVDLARMEHSHLIAQLEVPAGTKLIEFKVELAPAGGFESDKGSGWVDTRRTSLSWVAEFANLAEKNKAVIEVDASTSLIVRDEATLAFVPKFRMRY